MAMQDRRFIGTTLQLDPEVEKTFVEEFRRRFSYNKDTGVVTYLVGSHMSKVGDKVGSRSSDGYLEVRVNKRLFKLHRVIVAIVNGKLPVEDVDHIDRDRLNNKWSNLRETTRTVNMLNKQHPLGVSGYRGVNKVLLRSGVYRYIAKMSRNGVLRSLGSYATIEAAIAARKNAELAYGSEQGSTK